MCNTAQGLAQPPLPLLTLARWVGITDATVGDLAILTKTATLIGGQRLPVWAALRPSTSVIIVAILTRLVTTRLVGGIIKATPCRSCIAWLVDGSSVLLLPLGSCWVQRHP
jgi:hypothetical protein